ncbi:HK97-gp10 family putative phage morphogenesis protein [Agrobacterium tumefaciens]|uniref:HK97-gp10 family putative phage morphogenesis protein n=1 Tax=Agrobacterium tumefaciens TaxID=358 RepID=UPI001CBD1E9E|nr:HK97-gp10 family putative phage morphogenesis protein [Agrobacterium tumefaciens]MDP9875644.1 HK97 gp10 family phage protein [Agrobacterium tumefaciens]MDP9980559.1 HK97 gp10 family phage protein [Agrobacterium tumefaciens]
MKIIGIEKMMRRLERIPDEVRRRAKAELMLGGREINMLQRSLVPKDDLTLASTIRSEPLPDPQIGVVILAGGEATTKPVRETEKGNSPEYDYALAQEFGTEDMPANPFFRPAIRVKKKQVRNRVRAAARKALRSAAKK